MGVTINSFKFLFECQYRQVEKHKGEERQVWETQPLDILRCLDNRAVGQPSLANYCFFLKNKDFYSILNSLIFSQLNSNEIFFCPEIFLPGFLTEGLKLSFSVKKHKKTLLPQKANFPTPPILGVETCFQENLVIYEYFR